MDHLAPEALIALLGAVIAAYSLLSDEQRLRLRLRMHPIDWVALGVSLFLVHYIVFYPVLVRVGWTLDLGPWRWGFTPALASYAILLGATLFISFRTWLGGVSRTRIPVLGELIERLLHEKRFAELFVLVEDHLPQIGRAYRRDYWLPWLRTRFAPSIGDLHVAALQGEDRRIPPKPIRWLAERLPTYEATQERTVAVVRRLFLSETFVEALAETRPYLGLEILSAPFREVGDFQDLWFDCLLRDPRSVLHFELKNSQNVSARHRYFIPGDNRILRYFFADAEVAKESAVYRSFGQFGIRDLEHRRKSADDRYNQPLFDFDESGCWKAPFHSVIRLFDLMVSEALYQGIQWHMWLYYLPYYVEDILRNLNPAPDVDEETEWPTPYHYFLYEIVSMHRDWLRALQDVPANQPNTVLEGAHLRHENGNIPKSAILSFGIIMGKVLSHEGVSHRFKTYLLEIPLRAVRDIRETNARTEYADLLLRSIVREGYHDRSRPAYWAALAACFATIDHPLQFYLEDEWTNLMQ